MRRREAKGRRSRRSWVWVREILSPAEARAGYPRRWEVAQVVVPGLTNDALSRVVSLVVDTPPGAAPAGGGRPASG